MTEHSSAILGLAVDSKQIETELEMDLTQQGIDCKTKSTYYMIYILLKSK